MTDLLPSVSGTDEQKSDTIYAATILGFCAIHWELGHRYAFEGEAWNTRLKDNEKELQDYQAFLDILSGLAAVLEDCVDKKAGKSLGDGLSPTLDHHNVMICGWPGGHAMRPHDRVFVQGERRDDQSSGPERQRVILNTIGSRVQAEVSSTLGYVGPGAYTGAVMERNKESVFSSTTQCIVVPPSLVSARWTPSHKGIAEALHKKGRPDGFGAAPTGSVIGYTHGMCYAMRDALATSPGAVATEIASGSQTTKQASCFGCTTYMWANGFPPSATHLGSALSWHPIVAEYETDEKKRAIVESMNVRYHLQVHGYLLRGAEILVDAAGRSARSPAYYVSTVHGEIARSLLRAQKAREAKAHVLGANYFLDACMHHRNDKLRIKGAILSHLDGKRALS